MNSYEGSNFEPFLSSFEDFSAGYDFIRGALLFNDALDFINEEIGTDYNDTTYYLGLDSSLTQINHDKPELFH